MNRLRLCLTVILVASVLCLPAIAQFPNNGGVQWGGGGGSATTPNVMRCTQSANFSVPNAAVTSITFDTNDSNGTSAMHSTSSNKDRFIAPSTGWYVLTASVAWATSAGGQQRYLGWLNSAGTQIGAVAAPINGNEIIQNCTITYYLVANDYCKPFAYQDSGGALNLNASGSGGGIQASILLVH